jgi:predicted porin
MKKIRTISIAVAGIGMLNHVQAQSSVTLYGLLDNALIYTSNVKGGRDVTLESGGLQGSR